MPQMSDDGAGAGRNREVAPLCEDRAHSVLSLHAVGESDFEIDDYRMHFDLFGDPAGDPLLWLSGWTGTGADWKYIFGNPPAGYRIIGPDLRGNGDRDPLYPVRLALELREAIPRSTLWVVPGGGYGPVFGSHATRFAETATAFLAGR